MAASENSCFVVGGELVRRRSGRGYLGDGAAVWDVCGDGVVILGACFAVASRQNAAAMDDCAGACFWRERWVVAR